MLKGYKTYITAGVAIITAAADYLTGTVELGPTLQLVFTAVFAATLRNGMN